MELVAEHVVSISHPDKLYWPALGLRKIDLLNYLVLAAPVLLPYLHARSLTMIRYPNGIEGHKFYQKDAPAGMPDWVTTVPVWSDEKKGYIHTVVVDKVATLLWLGNLGCLEYHAGFTTVDAPEHPTHVAFDLDPTVQGFEPVRQVALQLHSLLTQLEIPHVAKTSGATGLQIFIRLSEKHSFEETRVFTKAVAQWLLEVMPNVVTLERLTKNRGTKVYVDYPQHGHTRTLIAAYSPRATAEATVSTPVTFTELEQGLTPSDFTIRNVPKRIQSKADLFATLQPISLKPVITFLERHPVLQ